MLVSSNIDQFTIELEEGGGIIDWMGKGGTLSRLLVIGWADKGQIRDRKSGSARELERGINLLPLANFNIIPCPLSFLAAGRPICPSSHYLHRFSVFVPLPTSQGPRRRFRSGWPYRRDRTEHGRGCQLPSRLEQGSVVRAAGSSET